LGVPDGSQYGVCHADELWYFWLPYWDRYNWVVRISLILMIIYNILLENLLNYMIRLITRLITKVIISYTINMIIQLNEEEKKLSLELRRTWSNFAKFGTPTLPGLD
jgi:hypothetical protein